MRKIYVERTIKEKKDIISHVYENFQDSLMKKWCDDWNEATRGEYIKLNMYMYYVNPYIGVNV